MTTFDPCREKPHTCPLAKDAGTVRFHRWESALSFALGRSAGQIARYRVYSDGSHWRTQNLLTGDDV